MSQPIAGWYPDPERPGATRFWDGTQWAPQEAPSGATAENDTTRFSRDGAAQSTAQTEATGADGVDPANGANTSEAGAASAQPAFGAEPQNPAPYGTAQSGTAQYETGQYGTGQYGTGQYGSAQQPQYGAAPYASGQPGGSQQHGSQQYGSQQYTAPQYGAQQPYGSGAQYNQQGGAQQPERSKAPAIIAIVVGAVALLGLVGGGIALVINTIAGVGPFQPRESIEASDTPSTFVLDVPAGGNATADLEIVEAGNYAIAARALSCDATLELDGAGLSLYDDDSGGGTDALIEEYLTPHTYTLKVEEYYGSACTVSVEVERL